MHALDNIHFNMNLILCSKFNLKSESDFLLLIFFIAKKGRIVPPEIEAFIYDPRLFCLTGLQKQCTLLATFACPAKSSKSVACRELTLIGRP